MLDPTTTAIVLKMAEQLQAHGSWCGETHLQKALFFLDKKQNVPTSFEFVLYKHGPYSFDLHDTLSSLFAHCLLEHEIQPPYGPRIRLSDSGETFLSKQEKLIASMEAAIKTVAEYFGKKGVSELEKLATALWVRNESPAAEEPALAQRIHEIKPHISIEDAQATLRALVGLS